MWHYRQTDGQNIYRIDAHLWGESAQKKIGAISQLGAEKIAYPPKPDIQRHTYIQTDISVYRVASLLKMEIHTHTQLRVKTWEMVNTKQEV